MEIEAIRYKDIDLKGGTLINGFPNGGIASSIVANYLISTLGMDQIGALDSEAFPPISMVYNNKPKFPARIYAHEESKLAIFIAEFKISAPLARPIARKMHEWSGNLKCSKIISIDSIEPSKSLTQDVYAVGSTDNARKEIEELEISPFHTGIVGGLSGVLLNLGKQYNFDVYSLLAQTQPKFPDARSAADVLEIIMDLCPNIKIDVGPLYREANRIEEYVKSLQEQAKAASKETGTPQGMYR